MTYNPLCTICQSRPKMDRSSCCEECWYSGAYTAAARRLPPEPRRGFHWERVPTGAYIETRDDDAA